MSRTLHAAAFASLATLAAAQEDDTPQGPEPMWSVELQSDSKGCGAIADVDGDGRPEVVFGTYFNDEHVYALNGEDGSVLWKHRSGGGPLDASVAVVDVDGDEELEALAADSASGALYCLAGDGELEWTLKLPSGTDSPPAVADLDGDGTLELVVGSMWRRGGAGSVGCWSAKTREARWIADVPGCVQSAPGLVDLDGDGALDVLVTSWRGDRGVHALSGRTGDEMWTFTTAGDDASMGMYHGVTVTGAGDDTRVFTATCEGDVYALDRRGEQVWTRHFDDYLFAPTIAADLDGDGALELVVGHRGLYCLNTVDGELRWSRPLGGRTTSRGAVPCDVDGDGDLDLVLAAGTELLALDGPTGAPLWSHDARTGDHPWESIDTAPLLADLDGDGGLDVFFVVGKGTRGGDDTGEDNYGRAVALSLGAPVEGATRPWTTFRGSLRRTGVASEPATRSTGTTRKQGGD